ncbi:TRAP transporter small permease [Mameliella sediminis]|uniref:TRAP transporter small permease n=1 Tax=Mameliella sediminis TaxID=2836866 RepID=UPI001C4891DA|nr:TRAP transporter small permease [Mameliella sediminis]MBV7392639.1 TRAP transporter small permease [Mameliella sediminis]
MSHLSNLLTGISRLLLGIAALAAGLMMLHVTADVASKLFLLQPIIGTLETVSLFYMVTLVFLPLAVVQRDRQQVFIELFTQNLPARGKAALDAFALLLTLIFCALLTWKGFGTALEKTLVRELSTNIEFQVQVWPGRWLPVLGYGATCLWCLLQLIQDIPTILFGASDEQS